MSLSGELFLSPKSALADFARGQNEHQRTNQSRQQPTSLEDKTSNRLQITAALIAGQGEEPIDPRTSQAAAIHTDVLSPQSNPDPIPIPIPIPITTGHSTSPTVHNSVLHFRKVELQNHMKRKVLNFLSASNPLLFRLKMAHKIKKINESLMELKNVAPWERVSKPSGEGAPDRDQTDSFFEKDEIVVRRGDVAKNIVETLINSNNQKDHSVMAIVGMADRRKMGGQEEEGKRREGTEGKRKGRRWEINRKGRRWEINREGSRLLPTLVKEKVHQIEKYTETIPTSVN